jgi:hypothetical protein
VHANVCVVVIVRRGVWAVAFVVSCRSEAPQVQPVASASVSASASAEAAPSASVVASASATATGLASALHHSIEPPMLGSSGPTAAVAVRVSGGVPGDDGVITAMNGRFRACADQALARDPSQRGRLVITVDIAAGGTVSNADVTTNIGLAAACADCMVRGVRHARFSAGAARKLTVAIDQTSKP